MTDLPAIITSLVAATSTVGTALAFVWNKIEKRFLEIEGELEKCRQREFLAQNRSGVYTTAIELLWQEIARIHPEGDSLPLVRVKKLLDGIKDT